MDFISTLLQPTGFWENIVFGLESVLKDYGLTLIIMTLIIKVVMLPFDFYNKYITKVNGRKQAAIKPQEDKLRKAYANNQQVLNQKIMELYKKENFSIMGTCLGMLLNLVVTTVVFFTLFASLNSIATYKQTDEFMQLRNTYNTTYQAVVTQNPDLDEADLIALATQTAKEATVEKYGEIKASFLWIKNIWKPDTNTNSLLNYKEFSQVAGDLTNESNPDYISEAEYNKILEAVQVEFGGPNGLYILIVLAALVNYLTMQIPTWIGKLKAKRKNTVYSDPMANNKVLVYILPLILSVFTYFYNAAFGLYIVTGAIFGLITTPLLTLAVTKIDEKIQEREKKKNTVSYSRNK